MDNNELYLSHHGTKGMRWGIRRYQNSDGSLTPAGKKRYGTKANFEKVQAVKRKGEKLHSKETENRKKANARTEKEIAKLKKKYGIEDDEPKNKEPSIEELREATTKLQAKNAYDRELDTYMKNHPPELSRREKFMKSMIKDVITPSAKSVGKKFVEQKLSELLGVKMDNKDDKNKNNDNSNNNNNSNKQKDKPNKPKPESDPDAKAYKKAQKEAEKRFEQIRKEHKRAEKEAGNNQGETNSEGTTRTEQRNNHNDWTVEGEGTSKYVPPKGPEVDGDFKDIRRDDPVVKEYAAIGESYLPFLLEDKRGGR